MKNETVNLLYKLSYYYKKCETNTTDKEVINDCKERCATLDYHINYVQNSNDENIISFFQLLTINEHNRILHKTALLELINKKPLEIDKYYNFINKSEIKTDQNVKNWEQQLEKHINESKKSLDISSEYPSGKPKAPEIKCFDEYKPQYSWDYNKNKFGSIYSIESGSKTPSFGTSMYVVKKQENKYDINGHIENEINGIKFETQLLKFSDYLKQPSMDYTYYRNKNECFTIDKENMAQALRNIEIINNNKNNIKHNENSTALVKFSSNNNKLPLLYNPSYKPNTKIKRIKTNTSKQNY